MFLILPLVQTGAWYGAQESALGKALDAARQPESGVIALAMPA